MNGQQHLLRLRLGGRERDALVPDRDARATRLIVVRPQFKSEPRVERAHVGRRDVERGGKPQLGHIAIAVVAGGTRARPA